MIDFLIGLGMLVVVLPFVWRWKHNWLYLLFFSIFWVYLLAVVQAVFFPFAINTSQANAAFIPSINLIPFYFGSCFTNIPRLCARGLFENILLTVPFGFGLNFLARIKPRNFIWIAIAIGMGFEMSQLIISYLFKSSFRAIDINDAILNASGVLIGYAVFRVFAWAYLKVTRRVRFKPKGLLAEIYEAASGANAAGGNINS
jgi:glycopeptide antibiotics resistance protein